jgi:hypothetical protein
MPSVRAAPSARTVGRRSVRFELLATEGYSDVSLRSLTEQLAAEGIVADVRSIGPGDLLARLHGANSKPPSSVCPVALIRIKY